MARFRMGLTGGLASGKSTVARWLGEAGCTVLDADVIVADLYRPDEPGATAVEALFGAEVLTAEGAVDRPALAERVFADDDARHRLEAAIHPLVRRRFAELSEETDGILVYEATLLVEAGRADEFDLVVSVEAPEALRLERAVARGMEEDAARARLEAQGDGSARRARADRVIDNSGPLDSLRRQVDALLTDLRARLQAGSYDSSGTPQTPGSPLLEGVSGEPGTLGGSSVTLVTGNANKAREASRILGFELATADIDLPEIQGLDLLEVLREKGAEAHRRLGGGGALIVEETGLELDAFGGFPGPLVKWMLEAVGAEGIARAALALEEPGVAARCALLYRRGDTEIIAEGVTRGTLVLPPRGDGGFGWDPVFQPAGETLTYAELPPEAKDALGHRGRAWRALKARLAED